MRIRIVCFTYKGSLIAARLCRELLQAGHDASCFAPPSCFTDESLLKQASCPGQPSCAGQSSCPEQLSCPEPVQARFSLLDVPIREWTGRHFEKGTGLIFIGAAGIAVRSIAPHLKGKAQDPAVAVVDEKGHFAVSLLSGHLGGGNDLARLAASLLGAQPVITTATDLNGVFAVDLFAGDNGLTITDFTAAKRISAALLRGEKVGFFSEFPVGGRVPDGLSVGLEQEENILLSVHKEGGSRIRGLLLVPKAVTVGIGCRRDTPKEALTEAFTTVRRLGDFHPASIAGLASIDLKKEEEGLLQLALDLKLPLKFFTSKELEAAKGSFSDSEFVRQVTGVSNVCERAAVCGCPHGGDLAVERSVVSKVTVAAAIARQSFTFDREEHYIDENREQDRNA